MWFAIDTLEYLRKGGRIGAAQALARLGAADQADPHARGGDHARSSACAPAGARSSGWSSSRASASDAGAGAWVVQHIHDPDTARGLVDECRQIFGTDPVFVSEIGPVIGAHVGPGLLGVGGIRTDLLALD